MWTVAVVVGKVAEEQRQSRSPKFQDSIPQLDYNVSIHSHPLPSLLPCKARLLWCLLEEGATHPCPWRHTGMLAAALHI